MTEDLVKNVQFDQQIKDFNLQLAQLLGKISYLDLISRTLDRKFIDLNNEFGQISFAFERQEKQINHLNFASADNTNRIEKLESGRL